MEFLPPAFEAMALYSQFILYVRQPSKSRLGKFDKMPIDHRTGQIAMQQYVTERKACR